MSASGAHAHYYREQEIKLMLTKRRGQRTHMYMYLACTGFIQTPLLFEGKKDAGSLATSAERRTDR